MESLVTRYSIDEKVLWKRTQVKNIIESTHTIEEIVAIIGKQEHFTKSDSLRNLLKSTGLYISSMWARSFRERERKRKESRELMKKVHFKNENDTYLRHIIQYKLSDVHDLVDESELYELN